VPAKRNAENQAPASAGRIVVIVLALALAGLGIWFWSTRGLEPGPAGRSAIRSTLHLETFVLNLADPGQRSYLRVGIELGLGSEIGKGANAPPVALVRDTILGILGQARVEDLLEEKGKTKLKADLLHALQERVPGLGVEEVYFTEFLIQR
jgi:flagellar basal body-associated protein FliL